MCNLWMLKYIRRRYPRILMKQWLLHFSNRDRAVMITANNSEVNLIVSFKPMFALT